MTAMRVRHLVIVMDGKGAAKILRAFTVVVSDNIALETPVAQPMVDIANEHQSGSSARLVLLNLVFDDIAKDNPKAKLKLCPGETEKVDGYTRYIYYFDLVE